MTTTDLLAAVLSVQVGVIVGLAIWLGRLSDRLARLEEWVRVREKMNGRNP